MKTCTYGDLDAVDNRFDVAAVSCEWKCGDANGPGVAVCTIATGLMRSMRAATSPCLETSQDMYVAFGLQYRYVVEFRLMATTLKVPSAMRASTRWEPRRPEPPVTRMVLAGRSILMQTSRLMFRPRWLEIVRERSSWVGLT
jgi:hypothetical protein